MKKQLTLAAIALAALSGSAFAGTASTTANFQVSATLSSSCVITAGNVDFGTITPAATGTTPATGTITSTCSNNVPYTLAINAGNGTIAARTMKGAISGNTDALTYNLYTTSALTTVWGDGTSSSATVSGTGSGVAQTNTVYGSLSNNQYLKPDTYTDNLTVSLSY